MSDLRLQFHGAAQTVTGSMHLLHKDGRTVVLDCGLYQGRRADARNRNANLPVPVSQIEAVILSHSHIDHSGNLPLLVKKGYRGPIYATPATRDLCAVMLMDAAHIQEEDARFYNKRAKRRGSKDRIEPHYTQDDATEAIKLFRTVSYSRPFQITNWLRAQFEDAGHILGSAWVWCQIKDGKKEHRLIFSGDIGRKNLPILRDPSPLQECDYVICESTYGGRYHENPTDMKAQLGEIIGEAVRGKGKILVPAFSVGRTQTLVYFLHQLMDEEVVPEVPVYVDSPLSTNVTEVFRMHPECYDQEARDIWREGGHVFGADRYHYIRNVRESKQLNRREKPCVIISASGMCESGRILHHLRNNLGSKKNTILIVGYQAAHTLGRRLVEGDTPVRIFGELHKVRARVVTLNGMSSHADAADLREILLPLGSKAKHCWLVHGEPRQSDALAADLQDSFSAVTVPAPGDEFKL